jgi:hypothetical protein
MKKIFLLAAVALSSAKLFAQENKEEDTLKIKWKNSRIWIFDAEVKPQDKDTSSKKDEPGKKDFTHWGGIDLGLSMLTTVDNKLKISDANDTMQMNTFLDLNRGKSWFFSFNLMEKNIRLYKNYANLVTGLGIEWNNYNFKKNITLDPDAPYISVSNTMVTPDSIKFSKNKLVVTYAKVPLILELNTNSQNPHKSFHIAGGIEFAYKLGSKTKQVYEINGYQIQSKRRDEYHLADIKYCSVVRVGYGDFTLFANYGLSQLFEKDKGPGVYPLTAGVSFTF